MYRCRRLNKSTGGGSSWQTSDITLGGKHTLVLGPEYVVNTGATEPLGKQRFFENKGFLKAKGPWKQGQNASTEPSTRPSRQAVELAVFAPQVRDIGLHPHR